MTLKWFLYTYLTKVPWGLETCSSEKDIATLLMNMLLKCICKQNSIFRGNQERALKNYKKKVLRRPPPLSSFSLTETYWRTFWNQYVSYLGLFKGCTFKAWCLFLFKHKNNLIKMSTKTWLIKVSSKSKKTEIHYFFTCSF